jgi:hypothetical protein
MQVGSAGSGRGASRRKKKKAIDFFYENASRFPDVSP